MFFFGQQLFEYVACAKLNRELYLLDTSGGVMFDIIMTLIPSPAFPSIPFTMILISFPSSLIPAAQQWLITPLYWVVHGRFQGGTGIFIFRTFRGSFSNLVFVLILLLSNIKNNQDIFLRCYDILSYFHDN